MKCTQMFFKKTKSRKSDEYFHQNQTEGKENFQNQEWSLSFPLLCPVLSQERDPCPQMLGSKVCCTKVFNGSPEAPMCDGYKSQSANSSDKPKLLFFLNTTGLLIQAPVPIKESDLQPSHLESAPFSLGCLVLEEFPWYGGGAGKILLGCYGDAGSLRTGHPSSSMPPLSACKVPPPGLKELHTLLPSVELCYLSDWDSL